MRRIVGVVIGAMILLSGAAASAQEKPVALADLTGTPALAADDASHLARYIGERLHETKAITPLPPALKSDSAPRVVFVSVSNGEQTAHVVMSALRGAARAADGAVARVMKLLPDPAQRHWIKVDVVNRVEPLTTTANNFALGINPTLDGVELSGGVAFLPEELAGWNLVEGGRLIEGSIYDYLDARPKRAALPGQAELRVASRFGCASFFIQDNGAPLTLYRGHRLFQSISPDDLRAAADAAGAYLSGAVRETGRFDYAYRLDLDDVPRDYNVVRHAGTIWAMLDLYRDTQDAELLAAVDRAMQYLLAQVRPMKIGGADVLGVVEAGEVTLGGNALGAMALATYIEVTGKKEHLPILRAMGRALRAAQSASGRFDNQRQEFLSGAVFAMDSPYYPGEAALAMMKIDEVEPDAALVDAAARAVKYLITVRDAEVTADQLPHDHWLLYALCAVHPKRPDELYLNHARKMAAAIVAAQHKEPGRAVASDAVGSYADARSTAAAVRSEGLLATVRLLRSAGQGAEAEPFLAAAKASVAFQLRTQVWPESAMHFRSPRRAIGAFRDELGGVYVRIDFVQHNLSSILALMRTTRVER